MNFASLRARAISYRDMGAFTMRNALRTHSRPGEVTVSSRDDSWVSTHGALVNTDTPVAVTMANGTLVTDPDTNSALSEWDVPVVHRGRYTLPLELARVSNAALRFMSKGRHPFNQPCVRLVSDVRGSREIVLGTAGYFDGLCSNRLAGIAITVRGGDFDFVRDYLTSRGGLTPLRESELANGVGVSTLALTTDGHLVLPHQGALSMSSGGLLAPSGSGSLDLGDIRRTSSETLITGATRELSEECGLSPSDIGESVLIGFGRWLDNGAKPEFVAVTQLLVDSERVLRSSAGIGGAESIWTHSVVTIPVDMGVVTEDPYAFKGSVLETVSRGAVPGERVSVPLEFGVRCLVARASRNS